MTKKAPSLMEAPPKAGARVVWQGEDKAVAEEVLCIQCGRWEAEDSDMNEAFRADDEKEDGE